MAPSGHLCIPTRLENWTPMTHVTLPMDEAERPTGSARLHLLGGDPRFERPLAVGAPNPVDRDALFERINAILDRNWLTNDGPTVREFEDSLAALTGARHVIAICNGTVALEIAARAAGLTGEVIVPSFTFVATAHALLWQGITPVFCDIDPDTHLIDPARVEELITPATTGILAVHTWGNPCNDDALQEIATRRNLKLIYDAAHALGNSFNGRMIGNLGQAEIFSFHATKFISSFEGGAIATNDRRLAETARYMRNFGFAGIDQVTQIGTNGKMHEISAAMGLVSLKMIGRISEHNQAVTGWYEAALSDITWLRLLRPRPGNTNAQYVVIEVDEQRSPLTRDELISVLWSENIRARRYFHPCVHRMGPYNVMQPDAVVNLQASESVAERVVVLPGGAQISKESARVVARVFEDAAANAEAIRFALAELPSDDSVL